MDITARLNQLDELVREAKAMPLSSSLLVNRDEVLDLIDQNPELGKPLENAPDYLKAEAVYAASHEGAQHLDDILTRRILVSIELADRGEAAAAEVAGLVAPILGWDEQHVSDEIEHYRKRVAAERESQAQPDDETADAARLGAPDVRVGVGG